MKKCKHHRIKVGENSCVICGEPVKSTESEIIQTALNKILYEASSYFVDEGDYQPSEEEAKEKIRQVLVSLIE